MTWQTSITSPVFILNTNNNKKSCLKFVYFHKLDKSNNLYTAKKTRQFKF